MFLNFKIELACSEIVDSTSTWPLSEVSAGSSVQVVIYV